MRPGDTIAVAAKEVDFWVVFVCVATAEWNGVAACSRLGATQTQVAVGVDGELGVGAAAKGECEPDVLHRRPYAVAAAGQQVGRAGEGDPFAGGRSCNEFVASQ